jgi:hypothetical protein
MMLFDKVYTFENEMSTCSDLDVNELLAHDNCEL